MKILIADRRVDGPHGDWKEGWEFLYAFRNGGVVADIAGPGCPISEVEIPEIANRYDLVLVTENYPQDWKYWNWREIRTPVYFWAIDTHVPSFGAWVRDFVGRHAIHTVLVNNHRDLSFFPQRRCFWMPYGASKLHYGSRVVEKKRDVVFIGNPSPSKNWLPDGLDRASILKGLNVEFIQGVYGPAYVRAIQEAKICLNIPTSYDLNAKYFEIPAAGTFMLAKRHPDLTQPEFIRMSWHDETELREKIEYYLKHEDEREEIAAKAREVVFRDHSWEERARTIVKSMAWDLLVG